MLIEMMNKVLRIVSYILLFVTSFFVISQTLLDSVAPINYRSLFFGVILFMVILFLAKYINDLSFLAVLKFRKIPISFHYIFPYFRFNNYSKIFIDPMFLTRSYEYFKIKLNDSNVGYIKKAHLTYLQVVLIVIFLLIYLFGWQYHLYLPIFILYFGSNIKHPSNDELLFIQSFEAVDAEYEKYDDKLVSNLQFHTIALMYIENTKLNNVDMKLNVFNPIYSMRDLEFIRHWSMQDRANKEFTKIASISNIEFNEVGKIIKLGIVPLHLKYYKFLIENYYNKDTNSISG
jgi:hypothetical protein